MFFANQNSSGSRVETKRSLTVNCTSARIDDEWRTHLRLVETYSWRHLLSMKITINSCRWIFSCTSMEWKNFPEIGSRDRRPSTYWYDVAFLPCRQLKTKNRPCTQLQLLLGLDHFWVAFSLSNITSNQRENLESFSILREYRMLV
jgi:hypothetical protein